MILTLFFFVFFFYGSYSLVLQTPYEDDFKKEPSNKYCK